MTKIHFALTDGAACGAQAWTRLRPFCSAVKGEVTCGQCRAKRSFRCA